MPERTVPTESPASLPRLAAPGGQRSGAPDNEALRQIAGALSALARRIERLEERAVAGQRPQVTLADRTKALEQAREYVAGLHPPPASEAERVSSEVAVARYLTGE